MVQAPSRELTQWIEKVMRALDDYLGVRVHADEAPDSKMDVVVKQLNRNGFQGHKEWINELNSLGVVKLPNLVKLVGILCRRR